MLEDEEIKTALSYYNVKKVAETIGVSRHSLYNFLKGKDVYHSVIVQVSHYLEEKEDSQKFARKKKNSCIETTVVV